MKLRADKNAKALVIATNWWDLGGRIAILLRRAGFEVGELSPPASIVHKVRSARSHYLYRPWSGVRSILDAVDHFAPDLLVCADDQAVVALHSIHARMRDRNDSRAAKICSLVEQSLGDPQSYPMVASRSKFMTFAQRAGTRCATTFPVTSDSIQNAIEFCNYPIAVKSDQSYGGRGVRIATSAIQVRELINQLAIAHSWPSAFMQTPRDLTFSALINRALRRRRTVSLQQFIAGRDANRAVVCRRGKVLDGISVEALETRPGNGPATLVRLIDHPEMEETAEVLVQRLGISGFCGFDFIIDHDNRAWLLEFNPRVTPASALAVGSGANLATAVFAALNPFQSQPVQDGGTVRNSVVALYQDDAWKSADCKIFPYYNDWWKEPEFLRASSVQRQANFVRAVLGSLSDLGKLFRDS